ncbi:hypothetical protein GCM10023190_08330 [Enteractinococcus fodinae]
MRRKLLTLRISTPSLGQGGSRDNEAHQSYNDPDSDTHDEPFNVSIQSPYSSQLDCVNTIYERAAGTLAGYLSHYDSTFLQNSNLFGIIQINDALLELDALNFRGGQDAHLY